MACSRKVISHAGTQDPRIRANRFLASLHDAFTPGLQRLGSMQPKDRVITGWQRQPASIRGSIG